MMPRRYAMDERTKGFVLAAALMPFTYSVGLTGGGTPFDAYLPLVKGLALLFSISFSVIALLTQPGGVSAGMFVARRMGLVWLVTLVSVPLLPFSYFVGISIAKLATMLLALWSINLALALYALPSQRDGHLLLARHLLYIVAGFVGIGLVSLAAWRDVGEARWYPTLNMIHPNIMASTLAIGLLHALLLPELLGPSHLSRREMLTRIFVLVGGSVLFGVLFSRGAVLALTASGALYLLHISRKNVIWPVVTMAAIAVLTIAALSFSDNVTSLLSRDSGENLSELTGRDLIWNAVLSNMDEVSIVTGFGYAIAFPTYSFFLGDGYITGTHNMYLQVLASCGVIGLLIFVTYILKEIISPIISLINGFSSIQFLHLVCILFIAIHGSSESLFGTNLTPAFALYLCCTIFANGQHQYAGGMKGGFHSRTAPHLKAVVQEGGNRDFNHSNDLSVRPRS